ncbi:MAG: DNA repair protein RadC [Candidatus Muirbacterium halophilum]|nr:DNA repair protein RadC [Candidatus Muirbacterium halophilum]MCK9476467.1 DNA repair protein RadC [Candidatus Muirbacterium halophilum]
MEKLLPREKTKLFGIKSLDDAELMSMIINTGIKGRSVFQISKSIVNGIDTMDIVPEPEEFDKNNRGLGYAKSCTISAALEFARRRFNPKKLRITSPSEVLNAVYFMRMKNREFFVVITLNGASEVINIHTVSIGIANKTQVHPREVLAEVISDRACSYIAVHNHPSGNIEPSAEDIKITDRLFKAGELLGIKMLDHIIVSHKGYYSMLENGKL